MWAEARGRVVCNHSGLQLLEGISGAWLGNRVSKPAGGKKGAHPEGMWVGMQSAARPTAGTEWDVRIIPGSAGSSMHEPADWELGQAVTDLGWPRSILLQVETDVKGASKQKGWHLLLF